MKTKLQMILFSFLIIVFSLNEVYPQSAGLNFIMGFPAGEFKDNINRAGVGVGGQFLFFTPAPRSPFGFGINVGFVNYGNETRREPFSTTIPDVAVDVERSNNLVNFHLLFQIAPYVGNIRPYAEALFGGSYLFTETKIVSRGNMEVASSTNFEDFAWSYGAGCGVLVRVYSSGEDGSALKDVFIDLKGRYIFGTEAEYLKEGSVVITDGRAHYFTSKSKTDLITAQIGVVAYFDFIKFE